MDHSFRIPEHNTLGPIPWSIPAALRFWKPNGDPGPSWDAATRSAAMLTYALAYAGIGWAVFPCCAPDIDDPTRCHHGAGCGEIGKRPLTANGWQNATTDPATIRAWWRKYRGANIAVSCGAAGVFVLDADRPKPVKGPDGVPLIDADGNPVMTADGVDVLDAFYDALGGEYRDRGNVTSEALDTTHCLTATRGRHYYWRLPEDLVAAGWRVRNATHMLPSVDVRGHDGYVIAPPSFHRCGRHYYWADPLPEINATRTLFTLHGGDGVRTAPPRLVDAIRARGLLVNPDEQRRRDEQRREEQRTLVAAAPAPAAGSIAGEVIDQALDEIVAETLPLAEGTAWRSWEPVNRDNPRGEWGWTAHAGRNEYLFRQVACRAWQLLGPAIAEDKKKAEAVLIDVLKRANERLSESLPEDQLVTIATSAKRYTPSEKAPLVTLRLGSRSTEDGRFARRPPELIAAPGGTPAAAKSTTPNATSTTLLKSPLGTKKPKPNPEDAAKDKAGRWRR